MEHYCNVLLKDGFDCRTLVTFARKKVTAHSVAQQKTFAKILAAFERSLSGASMVGGDDEKENGAAGMTDIALSAQEDGGANFGDFKQLLFFGKYFLAMMGCDVEARADMKNSSDLYVDFDGFGGVLGEKSSESVEAGMNAMTLVVEKTIELLNKKMPINDPLLFLCHEFCTCTKNDKLLESFYQSLESASAECVNEELVNSDTQARDYHWFKTYLADSNIWLARKGGNNDSILYKFLDELADDAKERQQEYIWSNVKKEEEADAAIWSVMLQFEDYQSDKYASPLRQDRIEQGNVAQMSYHELFLMSTKIEDSSKFNIVSAYDNKIYLTQCLASAHSMNSQFQKDVKDIFVAINKNCSFEATPVKTYEECVRIINSHGSEYTAQEFPRASSILNFLSCIVTFNSVKEMYSGLNQFMSKVNKGDSGCVTQLVKIENGLNKILDWKNARDSEYCDVTLSVIIHDKLSETSMIGEINLVLTWLLKANEMGVKLSEIKRRTPVMYGNGNLVKLDGNNDRYKSKLAIMMGNGDYDGMANELMLEPNRIFSIIDSDNNSVPLLYHCGKNYDSNPRMFDLFFNSLSYYHNVILQSKEKESDFVKKYLNFNDCANLISDTQFVKCLLKIVLFVCFDRVILMLYLIVTLNKTKRNNTKKKIVWFQCGLQ